MKRQSGFSLLELMLCCAVILILTAFMLPNAISSLQTSNEAAATNVLRQVSQAESSYQQLYPTIGYSQKGAYLGGAVSATGCPNVPDTLGQASCLLADTQAKALDATGTLQGYTFTYTPVSNGGTPAQYIGYSLTAIPSGTISGRKSYFLDQSGVIRYVFTSAGAPSASSTPLGQ